MDCCIDQCQAENCDLVVIEGWGMIVVIEGWGMIVVIEG